MTSQAHSQAVEGRSAGSVSHPDALWRHGLQVPAATPLVLRRVLDLGHPSAVVVAQQPPRLEARTPLALALDLDRAGRVVAALMEELDIDLHGGCVASSARSTLAHALMWDLS